MIERALEVVPAVEPITMARVQAMIWAMLAEKMENIKLLQQRGREVTTPIVKPVPNEVQLEEGSYSKVVNQIELRRVWRNNNEKEVNRNRCKYEAFMASQPPVLLENQHYRQL